MKPVLVSRQEAVAATLRKYRNKDFDWSKGITCGHMARFHMRQMGLRIPKLPPFRSELGCWKALRSLGHQNTDEWLDSLPGVHRIAPAEMLLGDLATVDSNAGEMQSIILNVAATKFLAWREDEPKAVILDIQLSDIKGAWRL